MMRTDKKKYPFFYQPYSRDCGIACLQMIAKFHGKFFAIETLRAIASFEKTGVSMHGLQRAAKNLGFEAEGLMLSQGYLQDKVSENPLILHWDKNHFVVLYAKTGDRYIVGDPSKGLLRVREKEFFEKAVVTTGDSDVCQVLVCTPTQKFFAREEDKRERNLGLGMVRANLKRFRIYFLLIFWAMLLGLFTQFLTPFFTKGIVDRGILSDNLGFVGYMIIGQAILILSSSVFGIVRAWISIHLSTRVSLSLISQFLQKMFRLPMNFFETRRTGDILQRIGDQSRIEAFLTRTSLSIVFALLTIIVYSFILSYFNIKFLLLFMTGAVLYAGWNLLFLKKRKKIDWKRFEYSAKGQSQLIQMINGVHDLKIYDAHEQYFNEWEKNQVDYYRNSFESLKIFQFQETGSELIFQLFQLGLTYLSASLVISNELTLGQMLSIQFIIGQLVLPVEQIIGAIGFAQDAKISYDRLFDIWKIKDEEEDESRVTPQMEDKSINFNNVTFSYPGLEENPALKGIDLAIASGKITAIVGSSGSGKTSILKLILGYSTTYTGKISVGGHDLRKMHLQQWRSRCGVVLQESFIFNQSIAKNISMSDQYDPDRVGFALRMANIFDYVESLPLKEATMIGNEGKGLSFGQRQRLLIARAIYKDPPFILLDEATNSLDAENEAIIVSNFKSFFSGRTVLIIAHRLSTIQSADNIVVLENGNILEQGTHTELFEKKGRYYTLMRKQLSETET
jgi:ATP-binding cassette subfamily B protein